MGSPAPSESKEIAVVTYKDNNLRKWTGFKNIQILTVKSKKHLLISA
jgi:hypothetical protein